MGSHRTQAPSSESQSAQADQENQLLGAIGAYRLGEIALYLAIVVRIGK